MSRLILENIARGWNRSPIGSISGGAETGVFAALWSHGDDDVQEVKAEIDPHHHIVCVMHGGDYSAELWKDEKPVFNKVARRNGVCVVGAGVLPRAVHRGRWAIMHLYVPDQLVSRLVEEEGLVASRGALEIIDPQLEVDADIGRISHQVSIEMKAGAALSKLRIDVLGMDLAIGLIRRHSNLASTSGLNKTCRPSQLAPWQVKRTIDYLQSDIARDTGLGLLAAQSSLSPFHFARAFKASTGLPPHQFLIQLRMDRARELLETSDVAITEIAAQVGYEDPGHLARLFRRHFGTTPAIYRRERRR